MRVALIAVLMVFFASCADKTLCERDVQFLKEQFERNGYESVSVLPSQPGDADESVELISKFGDTYVLDIFIDKYANEATAQRIAREDQRTIREKELQKFVFSKGCWLFYGDVKYEQAVKKIVDAL